MAISPIQAYAALPVQAAPPPKPVEEVPQPVVNKDSAFISERAKDLAAQMSSKVVQEEAKEAPPVEQRELAANPTKPTSIAEG